MIGRRSDERGTAAVEFAITLPILVLVIVGILDYANVAYLRTKLFSAARAGAQYAFYHPTDIDPLTKNSTSVATVAGAATNDPGCTALITTNCMTVSSPTISYFCVDTSTGAIGTTAETATSSCGAGAILGRFVTVSTTQSYTPVTHYRGLGATVTLTGAAMIQVQ